jgi:hypothetical protein
VENIPKPKTRLNQRTCAVHVISVSERERSRWNRTRTQPPDVAVIVDCDELDETRSFDKSGVETVEQHLSTVEVPFFLWRAKVSDDRVGASGIYTIERLIRMRTRIRNRWFPRPILCTSWFPPGTHTSKLKESLLTPGFIFYGLFSNPNSLLTISYYIYKYICISHIQIYMYITYTNIYVYHIYKSILKPIWA